jgi:cell division protein FtsX
VGKRSKWVRWEYLVEFCEEAAASGAIFGGLFVAAGVVVVVWMLHLV